MKKITNKKNLGILLIVCFAILSICLLASYSIIRDKNAALANEDYSTSNFGAEVEHITGTNERVQITFDTNIDQVVYPVTLNKDNINKFFLKLNEKFDIYKDSLSYINKGVPITLVFDRIGYIGSNGLTSENLKNGFSLLKQSNSVIPFIDESKINVKELKVLHSNTADVELIGENAISNIPTCEYLEIEWAAFGTADCITNMPNLSNIYIYNHNDGFSNTELNKAIKGVESHCKCEVRLDRPNKNYYYVPATYDSKGTITSYQWSDNAQTVAETPEDVKYNADKNSSGKYTAHITIVGKKNSTDFGYATLQGAFQALANKYNGQSWFWNDFASAENITLRIETYGGYQSDCISQANLYTAMKPLMKYMPAAINKHFNLTEIELICATECQVYFRGPACIHDCPYLTNVTVERANFTNGSAPAITNCPNLSYIHIKNRSDNFSAKQFNSWVHGVKNQCKAFVDCWWPWKDGHYKYVIEEKETGHSESWIDE